MCATSCRLKRHAYLHATRLHALRHTAGQCSMPMGQGIMEQHHNFKIKLPQDQHGVPMDLECVSLEAARCIPAT